MKCPFCAEDIQPDAIKCRHCGEWLNKGARSSRTHPDDTDSTGALIGFAFFSALIPCFGFIAGVANLSYRPRRGGACIVGALIGMIIGLILFAT